MNPNQCDNNDSTNGTAAGEAPAKTPDAGSSASTGSEDIAALKSRVDELWHRLLRTTADYDNYRKRAAREKQEAVKFANEALLLKLLPVLDSMEMAAAAAQNTQETSLKSLQAGVTMVMSQLKSVLQEAGLEEIDAVGAAFDHNLHEAIGHVETMEVPEDHVAQQIRKGYRLKDRLLRPASVRIARTPPPAGDAAAVSPPQ